MQEKRIVPEGTDIAEKKLLKVMEGKKQRGFVENAERFITERIPQNTDRDDFSAASEET